MSGTAEMWKFADDIHAAQYIVLFCFVLSLLLAMRSPAIAQQPFSNMVSGDKPAPSSVHFTNTHIIYSAHGLPNTLKTEGWILFPNTIQLENDELLLIQKGDKHLYYNKVTKAYTEWYNLNAYTKYMPASFSLSDFLQLWKVAGGEITTNAQPIDAQYIYKGQPCSGNVEYAISPLMFNGGQPFYGRSTLHTYLSKKYPDYMLASEFRHWDVMGTRLIESEDIEYSYDPDIPNTLFDMAPPKGAVRDDHMPLPTLERNLLPFHAMHYLGVSQFPSSQQSKPRMFQCWYRDPDRYRLEATGNSLIYHGTKEYSYSHGTGASKEETGRIPPYADLLCVQSHLDRLMGQGRQVTTTTTQIDYGGKPAKLVTLHAEPAQSSDGRKYDRYEERIRIDLSTGLPMLEEIDHWEKDGTSIAQHDIIAYDYPDTIPDEVFAFTPHAAASPAEVQEAVDSLANKVENNGVEDQFAIGISRTDGGNLKLVEQISPHYFTINVAYPVHNWFAGQFTHLPTDSEVTLGLPIDNASPESERINLANWDGLKPTLTYADPTTYDAYAWFAQDEQGRWVSGDPWKTGDARYAGTGKVPQQTLMPAQLAEQFLSADGHYWQPWREVDATEAVSSLKIFRIHQRFAQPTATVAMRVPFTYTYYRSLLQKLRDAHLPGVTVDNLGQTAEGRELTAIRVEDPAATTHLDIHPLTQSVRNEPAVRVQVTGADAQAPDQRGVIVVYAREHAMEADGSWVVDGVLRSLLSHAHDDLLKQYTWILIPILDVDAASHSMHEGAAIHAFIYSKGTKYSPYIRYDAYLRAFANANRPIAMAVSIHNPECREYPVALSPFYQIHVTDPAAWKRYGSWCQVDDLPDNHHDTVAFNTLFFNRLRASALPVGNDEPLEGLDYIINRLGGSSYRLFDALPLTFEINSRYPDRRLSIKENEDIGDQLVSAVGDFFTTPEGQQRLAACRTFLAKRQQAMQQYWPRQQHPMTEPTCQELLQSGL